MMVLKLKKMYLAALFILMVVLVLLVLISISTYHNLDREQRNTTAALHRQGISLIHALTAGARIGNDSIGTLFRRPLKAMILLIFTRWIPKEK